MTDLSLLLSCDQYTTGSAEHNGLTIARVETSKGGVSKPQNKANSARNYYK